MNKTSSIRTLAAAALTAACAVAPALAHAQSDKSGQSDREAMDRAREQVEKAREELRRATRELARSMAKVDKENPRAQYFEFMTNPDRPMIGIIIDEPKEKSDARGLRVLAVTPGSGAEKAGLEAGDVITSIDGASLAATADAAPAQLLRRQMEKRKAGDQLKVEYLRNGKRRNTVVTTQSPEPDFALSLPPLPPEALLGMKDEDFERFIPPFAKIFAYESAATRGLELARLDEDLGSYFKTTDGILVVKAPKSDALGLKSGDVIQKIDGAAVSEPVTVMDKLRARGEERSVKIEVMRQGTKQVLASKIPVADARDVRKHRIEIVTEHDHDEDD